MAPDLDPATGLGSLDQIVVRPTAHPGMRHRTAGHRPNLGGGGGQGW